MADGHESPAVVIALGLNGDAAGFAEALQRLPCPASFPVRSTMARLEARPRFIRRRAK